MEGRALAAAALLLPLLLGWACGYRVSGRATRLPSNWQTIAVPAFVNHTSRYRIEQRLTEAVIHEFLARTKYRVVQSEASADGILHGEVLSIETSPILFDARSGRVTTMLVTVHARFRLTDRASGRPAYHADDWIFRDEYQISSDVKTFFEEQDPALERMSRDFAQKLVADIVENF